MNQAIQDRRIDYIEMKATDLTAIKKFYGEVFDWKFTDYGPTYTAFADGRLTGGFEQADRVGPSGVLVVIYARNLEAVHEAVTTAGGSIAKEIFTFPGGRRFHFKDPAGNELAVWSE